MDELNQRGPAPAGNARRARLYAALVLMVALAARLAYLAQIQDSPYYDVAFDRSSDQFNFCAWALRIHNGDLLGNGTFWQSPLYPYFLALVFSVTGPNLLTPRFVQLCLGAAGAVIAFFLGRRLKGDLAGLLAGLMTALYGPLIFYEAALLRDGLLAFLNTALVLAMLRARERPGLGRGLTVGLVLALAVIGKPNIAVMLPALAFSIIAARRGWEQPADAAAASERSGQNPRAPRYARLRYLAGAAAGLIMVFSVLVARNLEAGAPALALNQQGALELISGNVPAGPPYGWLRDQAAMEMYEQSKGSMFRAAWLIIRSYRGRWPDLVKREAVKTLWFLSGYEAPNNMNYYVEKQYVGIMALPWLTWPVVFGLAVAGIAATLREWRRAFELYAYVLLFSIATVGFYFIDRFRIPLVPAMCVFAGAGLSEIIMSPAGGRRRRAALLLSAAVALAAAAWPRVPDPLRVNDYRFLAHYHLLKKEPGKARAVIEEGREKAERAVARCDDAKQRLWLAQLLFVEGAPLERAEDELRKAAAEPAPGWIADLIASTRREVKRRMEQGDPRPDGFRI
ncbi:MAG TPA: glycosyltransferase family 39 protein [bacterium]|nr:glycosyltransferase family 39 protein [bacterium]